MTLFDIAHESWVATTTVLPSPDPPLSSAGPPTEHAATGLRQVRAAAAASARWLRMCWSPARPGRGPQHCGRVSTSFVGASRIRFEGLRLVPHSQRPCGAPLSFTGSLASDPRVVHAVLRSAAHTGRVSDTRRAAAPGGTRAGRAGVATVTAGMWERRRTPFWVARIVWLVGAVTVVSAVLPGIRSRAMMITELVP